MDDSVIKVLRRNGSWENTNQNQNTNNSSKKDFSRSNTYEEDFQLDEKFEILAKEIKKRMNRRGTNISKSIKASKKNHKFINKSSFEDIGKLKSQILPYLKTIEQLIIKKQNYLDSISEVDKELDSIYEDISKIKNSYLDTINQLKNNMNFFDDSLSIIKSAKEEK